MIKSETVGELFTALSKAQSMMTGAKKDSDNPFFKSKYADLHTVLEAVKDPLTKNDLCVIQTIDVATDGAQFVLTTLGHKSGEYIGGTCPIINTKGDAQGMGSAITYARRYSLAAIVGIAQMDDDGNEAVKPAPKVTIPKKEKDEFALQVRECLAADDKPGIEQLFSEYDSDHKVVLWGLFNSQERAAIKKLQRGE